MFSYDLKSKENNVAKFNANLDLFYRLRDVFVLI